MTSPEGKPNMESVGYTPSTLEMVARRTDPDIEIFTYQTSWPQTFTEVAARMQSALGHSALKLEHVGSTSVPDLAAKPIIDILLEVDDPSDEGAYVPQLEDLGFTLHFRQPKWHGHRFLALALDEHDAEINVHVHRAGCQIAAQFLTFRDFLRDNSWARDEYAEAKRKAAETSNEEKGGRLQYQRQKAAVLDRLKARALEESPSPPCTDCRVG
ncbi:hypothetical protein INS49_007858 [Diaporthe citri]|uniref:uncharacterized protein n=1 Tax=Diaporthe citri TaxID=83186 RepID=UPI001C7EAD9D|nr:uncharacterized protein INS49_007858 [Diaporthe citri]KAG6362764.1 hypothetical protein INS49_007858 [Diaporthe citri]